jgi:hypothetical protein
LLGPIIVAKVKLRYKSIYLSAVSGAMLESGIAAGSRFVLFAPGDSRAIWRKYPWATAGRGFLGVFAIDRDGVRHAEEP